VRRACSAVAAGVLLAAAVLPAAIFAGAPAASASTSQAASAASSHQAGGSTVAITITGISPQTAVLGEKVTVSGTVTNHSRQTLVHPEVRFLVSQVPVSDMTTLMTDDGADGPVGSVAIPGQATQPATRIAPGASSTWSITVPATRLGFTTFGAYPVTVQVSESDIALASANSFLPYSPPKRGHFASPSPRPQQIAWVLPLIDQPLTGVPSTQQCQSGQARTLAASMAKTGRLNGLLGAGTTRYARQDQVTWAVDPALLWDANQIRSPRCAAVNAAGARAASAWLTEVRKGTAGQPLFTTPYANVSLALVSQGVEADVTTALVVGRKVAHNYLDQNLSPQPPVAGSSSQGQTAGILWPPDGAASHSTVQPLAATAGISTVLLSNGVVTSAKATASEVLNQVGGYARVVLYNADLSKLLARAPAAPADRFGTEQAFLAATAVLAGQPSSQPILVVPPQLWHASGALAADLLKETATATWLSQVSVTTMASSARPGDLGLPPTGIERPGFSRGVIHGLKTLGYGIKQLSSLNAKSTYTDLQLALYALESSTLHLRRVEQLRMVTKLDASVNSQLKQVGLDIKGPVFLGGLKGNVPLIIDNQLDFPVRVRIVTSVTQPGSGEFTVQQAKTGLITVPAKNKFPTSLHVQATQAGAATITLHLVNDRNQALPGVPVTVTVHATQFGTLAMIILACALGIFVIASAARGLRRRPAGPDSPADDGHLDPDDPQGGEITAEPDTVVAEHSELGAAGRSGL
jgi:Family of unknown function (DUF6049)